MLELHSASELDRSRVAPPAIPLTKAGTADRGVEGVGHTTVVVATNTFEIVVVKCIEEVRGKLEGDLVAELRILCQGDVCVVTPFP